MSAWLPGFLLGLAPLLILVGLLVLGRYPGEAAIHRCRLAIDSLLRPRHSGSASLRYRPAAVLPARGGRLIARSMAGRAPPFTIEIKRLFSM